MTDKKQKHSPIGASSCERWWNCPGSVLLLKGLPKSKSSIHAATGTAVHTLGEIKLLDSSIDLEEHIDTSQDVDGFKIPVTEKMVESAEEYAEIVNEILGDYGLSPKLDLKIEQKFQLTHIDEEAFGTCDASITVPMNRVIVADYKNGHNVVEVEDNKQLLYYALGAYYAVPEEEREHIMYVELHIIQPNARHIDGAHRYEEITVDELLQFEAGLKEAVNRVRRKDAKTEAGSWCKWCDAKAICPSMRAKVSETAKLDFAEIETEPVKTPTPSSLPPERIAQIMENAETITGWCSSVIKLAYAEAERGTEIPGYKLVEKKGNRKWENEKEVVDAFEMEFGEAIFSTPKLKSPAQMEKLLKKRKAEIVPYVIIPTTGKTLVPFADTRREKLSSAVSDFM